MPYGDVNRTSGGSVFMHRVADIMEPSGLAAPASLQGVFMNRGHRDHRSPSFIGYFVHRSIALQSFLGVLVLWFNICVDLEQVGCVRAVQNVCSHIPIPGAIVNIRGGRRVKDVFLPKGRLRKNSIWLRKLATGDDFAAVSRYENETLCRAERFWGTRDGKLLPDWRSGKLLSPGYESSCCFSGKEDNRDCSHTTLKQCPSQPVRQDVAQVTYSTASAWPHFVAALAAGRTSGGWRLGSERWQHRARVFGLQVFYRDAGGGGNCMFLSIAAALLEIPKNIPALKGLDAQTLRERAAAGIVGSRALLSGTASKAEEDAFLTRLSVLSAMEDGGSWEDGFSPTNIYTKDVYTTSSGTVMNTKTAQEKARALYHELSHPGAPHWGMAMDLEVLEEQLPIGFIVFKDDGSLYPLGTRRDQTKDAYILMYFRPGHFQQAAVGVSAATARSALLPDEIPDFVQAVHWVDARAPVFPIPNLPLLATSR